MLGGWESSKRKIEEKDCHIPGRCHYTQAGNREIKTDHGQGGRRTIEAKR